MYNLTYEGENKLYLYAKEAKKMISILTKNPINRKEADKQWAICEKTWNALDWTIQDGLEVE